MALLSSASFSQIPKQLPRFTPKPVVGKWNSCRLVISWDIYTVNAISNSSKGAQMQNYSNVTMGSSSSFSPSISSGSYQQSKQVWIRTESKQVMTAAVERGWNTFIFSSRCRELAHEWSSTALICPLFIEEGELFDSEKRRVATISEVSSTEDLQQLQPADEQAENVIINLLDWQALEQGLGGVVLKVEDFRAIIELKDYFDRRNEATNVLSLTKATVTQVHIAGMGDRVCVDLCSLMRPGEGLLVGSFARGLFLVHSECLESNYIASRPFRVNAGPVHAYVAVPGGKTCYLSELKAGKEVIVVDQKGQQRMAIVGRVKIESRPLILVDAKVCVLYIQLRTSSNLLKIFHLFIV
ncbi:hypothetical protein L1049_002261 [Liquidambar formosana]|uniref:3-dehydroquinate synthase n=1 Tax=Liquidambar formosana TaxID=63359 RepID=A0AAP0NGT7_LIQFO